MKDKYIYTFRGGGNSVGKVLSMILYSRAFPKTRLIVKDLDSLDKLVAMGARPSQIIVTSEFKNTSRFDMVKPAKLQ